MENGSHWLILAGYFGVFLAFSVLINKILLRFARTLGIRDGNPEVIRWSIEEKPSLGGLSFYIIFLLAIASLVLLPGNVPNGMDSNQLFGLFAACTLGFLIGLADDAYNTRPVLKFLGQLTCANILITMGLYIELTPMIGINYAFTMLWVIGIMNSINMIDNMDGITASVSVGVIGTVIMIILLRTSGVHGSVLIMTAVLAAIIGFLVYNWHPAKMYMGDTGSQFLGVFLAAISISYLWGFKSESPEFFQIKQILIPLLAFIMPIIDTTTVFIRRLARGQSPFVGGRDHTTHHLAYLGLTDSSVALIFAGISLFSIVIVYFLYLGLNNWNPVYNYVILGYFIILFTIFQVLYEVGKKRNSLKEE